MYFPIGYRSIASPASLVTGAVRRRAVYNQGKGELALMVSTSDALLDRRSPPNDARYQSIVQAVNDSGKQDRLLLNKTEFSYDILSVDQTMFITLVPSIHNICKDQMY